MEEIEVVVAHAGRTTLRVGEVFLQCDGMWDLAILTSGQTTAG